MYRSDRDVLEYNVYAGIASVHSDITLRRGEGFCGQILETGKPFIVNNCKLWEGRLTAWEDHHHFVKRTKHLTVCPTACGAQTSGTCVSLLEDHH